MVVVAKGDVLVPHEVYRIQSHREEDVLEPNTTCVRARRRERARGRRADYAPILGLEDGRRRDEVAEAAARGALQAVEPREEEAGDSDEGLLEEGAAIISLKPLRFASEEKKTSREDNI